MAKRSRTKGMRIENDVVHEEMPTDTIDLNSVKIFTEANWLICQELFS
jgi:hypothetical protein